LLNFLGIGAQKAGTTWLYTVLNQHEKIFFPAGKEVHFWDTKKDRGIEWYMQLFSGSDDVLFGEITPAYAILPPADISRIKEYFPSLRIIYIIRNPVQRAWSSAKMALQRAEMTIDDASDQWFIDHFKSKGSMDRGDYENCIRKWRKYFSAEQFLVLKFDFLKNMPLQFIQRCLCHLGLKEDINENMQCILYSTIFKTEKYPLRESLYRELFKIYRDKIKSLEVYLNEDLSSWYERTE